MFAVDEFFEAEALSEALLLLKENPERRVIAGGTDLLLKMREEPARSERLVSIRKIDELHKISRAGDQVISIGALSTFSDLATHPLVREQLPILAEAALTFGGPQLREMATIGGNICNGAPSADSAPALFALEAKLKLVSRDGNRIIPIREFYLGPGQVDIKPGELLTEIVIAPENYRGFSGSYIKFAPRKAMDLAMIGVAVICRIGEEEQFETVRISLGVAAPTPMRCSGAEEYLRGRKATEEVMEEAGRLALKDASPSGSWRASRAYREHLISELTARALHLAACRAGDCKDA